MHSETAIKSEPFIKSEPGMQSEPVMQLIPVIKSEPAMISVEPKDATNSSAQHHSPLNIRQVKKNTKIQTTSRPTYLQIEALVQFLELNPGMAKGHIQSAQGKWNMKKMWEEITISLNSMEGVVKDVKGWIRFWVNKKYYLKKIIRQRKLSVKTGGKVDATQPLDTLDERMVAVLGGENYATGNPELRISEEPGNTETQQFFSEEGQSQPSTSGLYQTVSRPTYLQIEALVQYLELNPGMAKGHLQSAQGKWNMKKMWEEITVSLNSMGGVVKDVKGWIRFWVNKKYYLKKIIKQRKLSFKTGGKVDAIQPLDTLDERMVAVLGGDNNATVNPELRVPLNNSPISKKPVNTESQENVPTFSDKSQPQLSTSGVLPSARLIPKRSPQPPLRKSPRLLTRSPPVTHRNLHNISSRRKQLRVQWDRLITIEEKKVEAEQQRSEQMERIACSVNNLVESVKELIGMCRAVLPAYPAKDAA